MTEYQTGEARRGCKDFDELTRFNTKKVYMECLSCDHEWEMDRDQWDAEMPLQCPECEGQAIAHEYIIPNAFTYRWKRKNTNSPLMQVPIEKDYQKAVIYRFVNVQSIL